MKCNQSRPGFELLSPCPIPTTITITPLAPPYSVLLFSFTWISAQHPLESSIGQCIALELISFRCASETIFRVWTFPWQYKHFNLFIYSMTIQTFQSIYCMTIQTFQSIYLLYDNTNISVYLFIVWQYKHFSLFIVWQYKHFSLFIYCMTIQTF